MNNRNRRAEPRAKNHGKERIRATGWRFFGFRHTDFTTFPPPSSPTGLADMKILIKSRRIATTYVPNVSKHAIPPLRRDFQKKREKNIKMMDHRVVSDWSSLEACVLLIKCNAFFFSDNVFINYINTKKSSLPGSLNLRIPVSENSKETRN